MTSEQLDKLFAEIEKRRSAEPDSSYSAQLLADLPRATRKLGEEAVETIIAALQQDDAALTAEAADLLYHLLVVLAARNIPLGDVMQVLAAREGVSGLAEKAARQQQGDND
ncbi:MAG: phosphoribosyl-ATP diphosphatase [Alphaproteobacteria bacterium]|nr:phosphoribosyl-ATP diphosphatase [Alphaproteobacteria bacterium]